MWTRRVFDSAGLTQIPHGPYVEHVQSKLGGAVVLMIDVSGSMHGNRILEAVAGAKDFVREAVASNYHVGVMLWNVEVVALALPTLDGKDALHLLDATNSAGGENALDGPLISCHAILTPFRGDRVCALFGDGDLTPKAQVLHRVTMMKADNIRFITRGLGSYAAREFAEITDEDSSEVEVKSVDQLADSIAGMAASLKK